MKSLFPSLTYEIISFLNVHLAGLKYQPSAPPRANSWYRYFADLRNMSHTATISEKIQNIQNAGQRSTIEMITIFNTRNSSCFHASNSSRTWCNPPGIEKLLSPFPKMIFFGWAVAGSQPAIKKNIHNYNENVCSFPFLLQTGQATDSASRVTRWPSGLGQWIIRSVLWNEENLIL